MKIGACKFFLLALMASLISSPAAAGESVSAALAEEKIQLHAGFTGAEVALFGALEGTRGSQVELLVLLTGPPRPADLWRKENIAGMWINRDRARFVEAPAFFAYAVNAPLHPNHLRRFLPDPKAQANTIPQENQLEFSRAFTRLMNQRGLWQKTPAEIRFAGASLFHARFFIPASAPAGFYHADVYLKEDGQMRHQQRLSFNLERTGLAQTLLRFAYEHPFFYGLMAVLLAIAAGWMVSAFTVQRR